jgi:hypothetical protein
MKSWAIIVLFLVLFSVSGCINDGKATDIKLAEENKTDVRIPQKDIPKISENATLFRAMSAYQVKMGTPLRIYLLVTHFGEDTTPINISNLTEDEIFGVIKDLEAKSSRDTIAIESITIARPSFQIPEVGEDGRWKPVEEYRLTVIPGEGLNTSLTRPNRVLGAVGPIEQIKEDIRAGDTIYMRRLMGLMRDEDLNMTKEERELELENFIEDYETIKNYTDLFIANNTYREMVELPFPENIIPGEVEVKVTFHYSRTVDGYTFHNLSKTILPNGKKNIIVRE